MSDIYINMGELAMSVIETSILRESLSEVIDFDRNRAYKLFGTFKKYSEEIISEGYTGTAENADNLKNMAHRLKSCCNFFGAIPLEAALEKLEQMAATNKIENIRSLYFEVTQLAKETVSELEVQIDRLIVEAKKSA